MTIQQCQALGWAAEGWAAGTRELLLSLAWPVECIVVWHPDDAGSGKGGSCESRLRGRSSSWTLLEQTGARQEGRAVAERPLPPPPPPPLQSGREHGPRSLGVEQLAGCEATPRVRPPKRPRSSTWPAVLSINPATISEDVARIAALQANEGSLPGANLVYPYGNDHRHRSSCRSCRRRREQRSETRKGSQPRLQMICGQYLTFELD